MEAFCVVGECEEPTRGGRSRCEMHEKRWQRGARGAELTAPPAEELTPMERAMKAFERLMNSDQDDEYRENEKALRRALKVLAPSAVGINISEGLKRARARGVRIGRPPRLAPIADTVRSMVRTFGIRATARALGVSREAVRMVGKDNLSGPPSPLDAGEQGKDSQP